MKKLITLLTLALLSIGSAWADDISCSATVPGGQTGTFSNTDGIAQTGCTLKYSGLQGGSNAVTVNSVDYYKMGSDNAYVQLILNSGSFLAGDVLTATVTSNGGANAKTVNVKVGSTPTSTVSVKGTETKKITYTLTAADIESDGSIKIYRNTNGSNLRVAVFSVTGTRATETFTVTFNAGSNGTCTTSSLKEESAGAGVTLPSVTANSGYSFTGWYTAEGTKVGDGGSTYKPTANITLYAQYVANSAPTISFEKNSVSTNIGSNVTFTANTTGAPNPTVTWYQSESASNSGGTEKGTGNTYSPDVTAVGTYYYYAVAANGISPDATSEVITLTVTSPDKTISGNNYYVAANEEAINGEKILCDDITMEYITTGTFNKASADNTINGLNSNYVASIYSGTNGWGVEFTPSVNGKLAVGLIANNGKTFSITNVQSFGFRSHDANYVSTGLDHGTIFGSSWTPTTKFYGIITIAVVAGTTYKFSVSGSKMSLYGFEFTPMPATVSGEITASGFNTYSSNYPLDLSTITGGMAYVATSISKGKVVLTKCTDKVPATTGLFIAGTQGETFTISTTDDETAAPAKNLFVGMPNGGQVAKAADNEFNYVFGWSDVSNPGFYLVNATLPTLDAFKAYLHTTEALDAPTSSRLSFVFGDETTAISDVTRESEGMKNGETFNLNGQRISRPSKGLYIVNGKKLIMK